MNDNKNEAMFELVREVPTELSKKEVMQMIGTLPTLPPPGGNSWFSNINLNSIIMTTTTVALITSAVIYFSSPKAENPVPGPDPVSPSSIEQTSPDPATTAADDSIEAIKEIPQSITLTLPTPDTVDKPKLKVTFSADDKATTEAPQEDVTQPNAQNSEPATQPQTTAATAKTPIKVETSPSPTTSSSVVAPKRGRVENVRVPQPKATRKIDDLKLKRLKRTLLRELSRDELISSKKAMNVLHFKEGLITVNNLELGVEEFTKYSELLFQFRIEPGPDKRVVTDPKFVMVGDFTERGFKGSMHGRAIDLKFINDGVIMRGLLDESDKGSFSAEGDLLFPDSNNQVETGTTMIETKGKVQRALDNADNYGKLFSDSSDADAGKIDFRNGATISTIYEEGKEVDPIKISLTQMKKFKKALYKMLVADLQVEARDEPVVMLISPELFKVNNNEGLESVLLKKYDRFLDSYGIRPGVNRKILMNGDFIMIGDFNNGQFNGRAQGQISKKTVMNSLMADELKKSKLFGGDEEPPLMSEEREIGLFDKLRVSGLAVVYLRQGSPKPLRVEASGIPLDDIITEINGGVLNITTKGTNLSEESIAIYVTNTGLSSIEVEGAAEVFSQGLYKADILKLVSKGSGAIEMAVDVDRLHLQMDGGDIHLEGRADMEKVDFLPESDRGTLDQSGLNVIERWTHEGGQTWSEQDLPELRQALLSKLIEQGYISTYQNPASIQLSNNGMTVNGAEIAPNYLDEYRTLYQKYGLPTHANSRIWVDPDFMVIAEKAGDIFELEVIGTDLELNIEGSWAELEEAILHRQ